MKELGYDLKLRSFKLLDQVKEYERFNAVVTMDVVMHAPGCPPNN